MRPVHTRVNKEAKRDLSKVSWYRTLFRRWPIGGDVEGYVSKRTDRWRRLDRERDLNVEPVPFFLSLFCSFVDVVDVGFIIWDLASDDVSSFYSALGVDSSCLLLSSERARRNWFPLAEIRRRSSSRARFISFLVSPIWCSSPAVADDTGLPSAV